MKGRRRLRIALIDHTARLGGGEIALLNLVRALDDTRYEAVAVLFADGPLRESLEGAGVRVEVIGLSDRIADARKDALGAKSLLAWRDAEEAIRFVCRLSACLRRLRVDIVHTNSLKSDLLGGIAARMAGISVIWHVRDRIDADYLPAKVVKAFRFLSRVVPTCIVANSQATLDTLHLPARSRRMHVVHDGTVVAEGAVVRETIGNERAGPPVVGLVGRITRWKGQDVFIEAARLVHARFPEAVFQIIGAALFDESAFDAQIRATVRENGLDTFVHFLGFRTDVRELMGRLDILVHASTTGEPFGQVIIEGMAAGKPVVATRGGGVPEIVVDGVTGLLVPMRNAAAMATAIGVLLENRNLAREMGKAGLARVQARFTIAHTARRMERVYERLA